MLQLEIMSCELGEKLKMASLVSFWYKWWVGGTPFFLVV